MSSVDSSTNRHLRKKDLDAETILKLIAIEDAGRIPTTPDADFGLAYSPLIMETLEEWTITSGAFNHPPEILDIPTEYTIKRGQTLTIPFSAIDANNDPLEWSKTGVGTIDDSTGIYTYSPALSAVLGNKTVTIQVEDDPPGDLDSHVDSVQLTIRVVTENRSPTLSNPGNQTTRVGQTLTINLSGDDPDGDDLTYSTTATSGTINPSTGVYTFTPTATQTATDVTFTVTDPLGLSASRTISIIITRAPSQPPVLSPIGNRSITTADRITIQAVSTNPKSQTLTWSISSNHASISSTGLITYSRSTPGADTVTVTVRDADGLTDSVVFRIHTRTAPTNTPEPPVLSAINNRSIRTGVTLTITASSTNPKSQTLTWSENTTRGSINSSGVFTYRSTSARTENVTITVTDEDGLSDTATFKITVTSASTPPPTTPPPTTERPPVLSAISSKSVIAGQTLTVQASSTNPKSQTLSWSENNANSSISSSGLLTFSRSAAGTDNVTITVTDEDGLSDSVTFRITTTATPPPATRQPPVLTPFVGQDITSGQTLTLQVVTTNPKSQTLTWSQTSSNGSITQSGLFTYSRTVATGTVTEGVTITVIDEDDLVDTITVVIRTTAIARPPVLSAINNQSINTGELVALTLTCTNPDSQTLTWTANRGSLINDFNLATLRLFTFRTQTAGKYSTTITVTDGRGLSDSITFNITVTATAQPPVLSPISNKTIIVNEQLRLTATSTNPKSQTLTWSENTSNGSITSAGVFTFSRSTTGTETVTITVTDADGLSDTATFKITVNAEPPPPELPKPTLTITNPNRTVSHDARSGVRYGTDFNHVGAEPDGTRITSPNRFTVTHTVSGNANIERVTVLANHTQTAISYSSLFGSSGTSVIRFTVTVTALNGQTISQSGSLTITRS